MHNFESLSVTQGLKFVNFLLEIQKWNKDANEKTVCFDFVTWQMKRFQNSRFERENCHKMAFSRKIWFFNISNFYLLVNIANIKHLRSRAEMCKIGITKLKMTSWNSKLKKYGDSNCTYATVPLKSFTCLSKCGN